MPKMKSHRGASKRFKLSATGKVRRSQANHRHILTKKSRARKRTLGQQVNITSADAKRMRRLLA